MNPPNPVEVGQRVRIARELLGFTQTSLAGAVGMHPPNISRVESGKQEVSQTLLYHFATEGISADWILTGKGSPRPDPYEAIGELNPIPSVGHRAAAGYLSGYGDVSQLTDLPTYAIPGESKAVALEVAGDSMAPTIHDGDVLILRKAEPGRLEDNRVYVVVTESGQVLVKRVLDRTTRDAVLILKSDNPAYPAQRLSMEEVRQVWYVRRRITANLTGPASAFDRLNELEHGLHDVNSRLYTLESQLTRLQP
jgi:phage repressor protein C with HTH and peptisase S24 domain